MNKIDQLQNAIKLIRAEIISLGEQINNSQAGAERDELEKRMKELVDSIGFKWDGLPNANNGDKPKSTTIKLTMWQRFKLSYSANKKKYWAGLAAILGLAAGAAYYFVKMKNTEASVSSVMGSADVLDSNTETAEPPTGLLASVGEAIIKGVVAIKNIIVNVIHKVVEFVKNMFTKSSEVSNDGGEAVLGAEEAVPAVA